MCLTGKEVKGQATHYGSSTTIQLCYLTYNPNYKPVNKQTYRRAKMTKIYHIPMKKIANRLMQVKKNRTLQTEDMAELDHQLWIYSTFRQILVKSNEKDNEITVYKWRLESSVREAFTFETICFDYVTVIVQNEIEYWFGFKTNTNYIYTMDRSRPKINIVIHPIMELAFGQLPNSPIILAASNPYYKCINSKCNDCEDCQKIIFPMEMSFSSCVTNRIEMAMVSNEW